MGKLLSVQAEVWAENLQEIRFEYEDINYSYFFEPSGVAWLETWSGKMKVSEPRSMSELVEALFNPAANAKLIEELSQ